MLPAEHVLTVLVSGSSPANRAKTGYTAQAFAQGGTRQQKKVGFTQKTREGCGCFWDLLGGSRGKFRESPGKIAGKIFPNREMLQILGFRAPGKADTAWTLSPPSVWGVF